MQGLHPLQNAFLQPKDCASIFNKNQYAALQATGPPDHIKVDYTSPGQILRKEVQIEEYDPILSDYYVLRNKDIPIISVKGRLICKSRTRINCLLNAKRL